MLYRSSRHWGFTGQESRGLERSSLLSNQMLHDKKRDEAKQHFSSTAVGED